MSFFKECFKTDEEKKRSLIQMWWNKQWMGPIFKNMIKKKNLKKNWGYITVNLVKYIEIEKIKKEYEKKKNELCEDFAKNLKEDIEKRNPQNSYVTNYKYECVESAESRRIREQNAKEEQNRE